MVQYPKECLLTENQDYICSICHFIIQQPVQTFCGHRFCKSCINEKLDKSEQEITCELCSLENNTLNIIRRDEIRDDRAFFKDLLKCKVKCCYKECDWKGLYSDLEMHFQNCLYIKEKCILCAEEILRKKPHECDLNQICFLSCSYKFENNDYQRLSKSICRHSFYLKHLIESTKKDLGGSYMDLKELLKSQQSLAHQRVKNIVNDKEVHDNLTLSNTAVNGLDANDIASLDDKTLREKLEILFNEVEFIDYFNSIVHPQIVNQMQELIEMKTNDMALQTAQLLKLKSDLLEFEKKEQINKLTISNLQNSVLISEAALKDLEIRLSNAEAASYDGTLIWQITDFSKKRDEALKGLKTSIFSSPFYTSKYGYKMSLRIYLNGDGMGKGTHVSLFFVLMKGNYDTWLDWPFRNQVTMSFLDQVNKNHIMDTFKPDPTSSSFRKPTTDMNIASGCPMFMPLIKLSEKGQTYIQNDTAYIKVVVNMIES